jgi:hypothetical protein
LEVDAVDGAVEQGVAQASGVPVHGVENGDRENGAQFGGSSEKKKRGQSSSNFREPIILNVPAYKGRNNNSRNCF